MRTLLLTALLGIFAFAAVAADVSGKWTAQVPGRNGQAQEQTFTFKADGAKLTGTISNPRGDMEISEGKIDGDTISFVTVRKMQDREMKMTFKGTVSGDQIKFTRTMPAGPDGETRPPQEFTANKAK